MGHFAGDHFQGDHFAGHYFGRGSEVSRAPNVVAALSDFLGLDDAAEAAASGAWHDEASLVEGLPYVVFTEEETTTRQTFSPGRKVDWVSLRFYVFSTTAADAKARASAIKARLLPSPAYTPDPLLFADGVECGRYSPGPDWTRLDPARSAGGVDAWCSSFPLVFIVGRG